jgi:aspartate aminotransferase
MRGSLMSFFTNVPFFPPDPIFGLTATYLADPRTEKVNLTVGLYKTDELKTPVLRSVKKAEAYLLENESGKEYLPTEGDKTFLDFSGSFVFGKEFWNSAKNRIVSGQMVGGTGGLRIGGEFVRQELTDHIYISDPSWANHRGVFTKSGLTVENYPYYDREKNVVDFDKLYAFLSKLKEKSVVVLHACCHNPTGAELSMQQWKELSELFLLKRLIPFDFAYQGFGLNIEEDAAAVRLFAKEGHEMIVCNSFSKNFGLYAERVGTLFIVGSSESTYQNVLSSLKLLIRTNFSNPPVHGARIVSHILADSKLKKEWEAELVDMRNRVVEMRNALTDALVSKCKTRDFSFFKDRAGMFSFSGLNLEQVDRLMKDYSIYLTKDGRMNVCGLNHQNIHYVVDAIVEVAKLP